MGWLLAVHAGAGRYAVRDEPAYLALMQQALRCGAELLDAETSSSSSQSTTALAVACRMLRVFERAELSNAGAGANLTSDGRVECEASAVCGRSALVSAVAKVRGVAEPSALAHALLEQASTSSDASGAGVGAGVDASVDSVFAFGRQAPLVVVGKRARSLARGFGLETADSDDDLDAYQVTPSAEKHWRKWHAKFQAHAAASTALNCSDDDAHGAHDTRAEHCEPQLLDTVGAICVDPSGNVAAAVSSGGIAYKVPGRVGLAGCPRMGCNAANAKPARTRKRKRGTNGSEDAERHRHGFAVACTGRGEHFVRSSFVSRLSHTLGKKRRSPPHLESAMRKAFVDGHEDNGEVPIEGGVLALTLSRRRQWRHASSSEPPDPSSLLPPEKTPYSVQLGAAFSTPCMGVGFLHSNNNSSSTSSHLQPHVQILRQPIIRGGTSVSPTQQGEAADEMLLSTHVSLLEI